jgi:hypothetical protein
MENSQKKKNEDDGIGWLTRPLYNIMLLSLVVLFTMQERNGGNYNDIFHILMFLSFAVIIILNVWNVFSFFRKFKNPKLENEIESEEE